MNPPTTNTTPSPAAARVAELELQLVALGDLAVAAWDNETVAKVDALVPDGVKYKDMLRTLFTTNPARIKELEAQLAARGFTVLPATA